MTQPTAAVAAYGTARRTLPPLAIVVELFDSALTAVAHARARRSERDPEREFEAVLKAARILQSLEACLDLSDKRTVAVATTLSAYYRRTLTQLHAAKRARGEQAVERYGSVYRQILTMRETWAELAGLPSLARETRQSLPDRSENRQFLPVTG